MRQNHAQNTCPAKNHRLNVVDTYQENRYTHLTYAPATHLRGDDVSKTTKYDFSSFTKGFPKVDKIGHQMRTHISIAPSYFVYTSFRFFHIRREFLDSAEGEP